MLVAGLLGIAPWAAFAHTPHDPIVDVVPSPTYASDHLLYAISDAHVLRSSDDGAHWTELVRGLSGFDPAQIAIAPQDAHVVYLASHGGGVARSTDRGQTWNATNAPPAMAYTTAIAVSPRSSDVVFAALGVFGGAYRTTDGGDHWAAIAGVGKVNSILFVPMHPGRVVVGADDGTVLISDDDGRSFRRATWAPGSDAITAIAVGTGSAASTLFAGTRSGRLLRSQDGGATWSPFGSGLPSDQAVSSLLFSNAFAKDHTLWASMWRSGSYRSTDAGATWTPVLRGLTTDAQAYEFRVAEFRNLALAATSTGSQELFLGGYDGLFHSFDGGSRWQSIETLSEYVTGIAVSPDYAKDGTVVVNTYVKGTYITRNGGSQFVESSNGLGFALSEGNKLLPVRRMHDVVFSPAYAKDHAIFTATWDHFVKSTDGGRSWVNIVVSPPPPGTSLRQFVIAVSPDYASDHTIFLGTRQGDLYRSTRGGDAGSWKTVGRLSGVVRSIVVSPAYQSDGSLFASTDKGVFRSRDAGKTWTQTGPKDTSLLAISPDYAHDHTVFAGSTQGLFRTRDAGGSWSQITAAPLAKSIRVSALAVSPDFGHDGVVLVSVFGRGLFRSTDGGTTFRAVGQSLFDQNLLIADFSNTTSEPIQYSPSFATDRTVYAYAEQSVVRSTDAGETWKVLAIPRAADFVRPEGVKVASRTASTRSHRSGTPWVLVAVAAIAMVVVGAGGSRLALRRCSARA